MATQLWKDGKSQWFPARRVALLLKSGWSVTDEPTRDSDGGFDAIDEAEIRQKAKEAGIKNHWNKSIENLLEELKD